MSFFRLLWINMKRNIKNKNLVFGCIIAPLIVMTLFTKMFVSNASDHTIYLINNDKGSYGEEIIKELEKSSEVKLVSKEEGIEIVKSKKSSICYEIQEDFTEKIKNGEKPSIIENALESNNSRYMEITMLNDYINKLLLNEKLSNDLKADIDVENANEDSTVINEVNPNNRGMGDTMLINFIISFVMFCTMGIIGDISELKQQNVFKRAFSTANSKIKIIGAFLGALLIQQTIIYIFSFAIINKVNNFDSLDLLPILSLNILMLVFVSLGIGTLVTKFIKDDRVSSVVVMGFMSVTCFIGGSFMPVEFLPKGVTMLSKFTPQYWAVQSINNQRYEYALIVGLFAIAIFLAGAYNFDKSLEN